MGVVAAVFDRVEPRAEQREFRDMQFSPPDDHLLLAEAPRSSRCPGVGPRIGPPVLAVFVEVGGVQIAFAGKNHGICNAWPETTELPSTLDLEAASPRRLCLS